MVRYVLLPVVDIMNENIKDVEIAWGTPLDNSDRKWRKVVCFEGVFFKSENLTRDF